MIPLLRLYDISTNGLPPVSLPHRVAVPEDSASSYVELKRDQVTYYLPPEHIADVIIDGEIREMQMSWDEMLEKYRPIVRANPELAEKQLLSSDYLVFLLESFGHGYDGKAISTIGYYHVRFRQLRVGIIENLKRELKLELRFDGSIPYWYRDDPKAAENAEIWDDMTLMRQEMLNTGEQPQQLASIPETKPELTEAEKKAKKNRRKAKRKAERKAKRKAKRKAERRAQKEAEMDPEEREKKKAWRALPKETRKRMRQDSKQELEILQSIQRRKKMHGPNKSIFGGPILTPTKYMNILAEDEENNMLLESIPKEQQEQEEETAMEIEEDNNSVVSEADEEDNNIEPTKSECEEEFRNNMSQYTSNLLKKASNEDNTRVAVDLIHRGASLHENVIERLNANEVHDSGFSRQKLYSLERTHEFLRHVIVESQVEYPSEEELKAIILNDGLKPRTLFDFARKLKSDSYLVVCKEQLKNMISSMFVCSNEDNEMIMDDLVEVAIEKAIDTEVKCIRVLADQIREIIDDNHIEACETDKSSINEEENSNDNSDNSNDNLESDNNARNSNDHDNNDGNNDNNNNNLESESMCDDNNEINDDIHDNDESKETHGVANGIQSREEDDPHRVAVEMWKLAKKRKKAELKKQKEDADTDSDDADEDEIRKKPLASAKSSSPSSNDSTSQENENESENSPTEEEEEEPCKDLCTHILIPCEYLVDMLEDLGLIPKILLQEVSKVVETLSQRLNDDESLANDDDKRVDFVKEFIPENVVFLPIEDNTFWNENPLEFILRSVRRYRRMRMRATFSTSITCDWI
eukprot:TRINITY_DN473_c2_g1_i2.p1 TRINITY_DN473_c2_g1~~TRINITY_DN473_c2_g1_i2.p1  ORF type:complete len:944 (+),score=360.74 TRINITY_DN473_c2_g1_i2:405-2834(+)